MEVKKWMKLQAYTKAPHVPYGSESMDKQAVLALEAFNLSFLKQLWAAEQDKQLYEAPCAFCLPELPTFPLPLVVTDIQAPLNLGSRVVNVSRGAVPFGLAGTIIALKGSAVDVVFDQPFLSGTTLEGKCRERCGHSLDYRSLLPLKLFHNEAASLEPQPEFGYTSGQRRRRKAFSRQCNAFADGYEPLPLISRSVMQQNTTTPDAVEEEDESEEDNGTEYDTDTTASITPEPASLTPEPHTTKDNVYTTSSSSLEDAASQPTSEAHTEKEEALTW